MRPDAKYRVRSSDENRGVSSLAVVELNGSFDGALQVPAGEGRDMYQRSFVLLAAGSTTEKISSFVVEDSDPSSSIAVVLAPGTAIGRPHAPSSIASIPGSGPGASGPTGVPSGVPPGPGPISTLHAAQHAAQTSRVGTAPRMASMILVRSSKKC